MRVSCYWDKPQERPATIYQVTWNGLQFVQSERNVADLPVASRTLCDGGTGPATRFSKHWVLKYASASEIRIATSMIVHTHTKWNEGVREKNPSPNLPIAVCDVTGDGATSLAEISMLGGVVCWGWKEERCGQWLGRESCAEICCKRTGKGGQFCENSVCGSD